MTSDCVVDVELFKKYSMGSSECNSCLKHAQCKRSSIDIARCLIIKGQDKFIIKECGCLISFFEYVRKGKCIIHYNDFIKKDYYDLFDKLPEDLKQSIY